MPDPFYPTIDIEFFENIILSSDKVIPDSKIKVGNTTFFVLKGEQAMHKRSIILRELNPGEISFELATSIAIKLSCMGKLIEWLNEQKNFKDGGYTLTCN